MLGRIREKWGRYGIREVEKGGMEKHSKGRQEGCGKDARRLRKGGKRVERRTQEE